MSTNQESSPKSENSTIAKWGWYNGFIVAGKEQRAITQGLTIQERH
ncbi:MAG: hypothetical protein HFG95_11225 [Dorea sp.]|nr:hypothetical protein [Dorea sp.]